MKLPAEEWSFRCCFRQKVQKSIHNSRVASNFSSSVSPMEAMHNLWRMQNEYFADKYWNYMWTLHRHLCKHPIHIPKACSGLTQAEERQPQGENRALCCSGGLSSRGTWQMKFWENKERTFHQVSASVVTGLTRASSTVRAANTFIQTTSRM